MTVWTRTVYLKTGTVLQTVSKDCSYFIREVYEGPTIWGYWLFYIRLQLWPCELGLFVWKLTRYYKLYWKTTTMLWDLYVSRSFISWVKGESFEREVKVLMKLSLKNSWTVFYTIFTKSTLPKHCWKLTIKIAFRRGYNYDHVN